jgi:hypothetical protein
MSREGRPLVDFENCVVAIVNADASLEMVAAVRSSGHEVMHLSSPEDADKLAANQEGLVGALSRMVAAYGDELRIMEDIGRALSEGKHALIVRVGSQESADISDLLKKNGAASIWDFRGWTFTKTGADDAGTRA